MAEGRWQMAPPPFTGSAICHLLSAIRAGGRRGDSRRRDQEQARTARARRGEVRAHRGRFKSDIKIRKGDEEVDGKSILGILLLAAGRGSVITLRADGPDEREALDAIEKLIEAKFDEVE
jgi:phosphocarrier protein